jgi:sugar phosphate isomerase/epimerase
MRALHRREFLTTSAGLSLAAAGLPLLAADSKEVPFKISIAQWSLHKTFFGKKADPADFAKMAKADYDIHAVEYVNQFYKDKKKDDEYLKDLKRRADDQGVKSVLIMCDGEGALGHPDDKMRKQAVENHYRWVEWAKFLGCHSIRVNAQTNNAGTYDEQIARAADGLRALTEFGAKHEINVIVENHGGLSSNGAWLAAVMKKVAHSRCGTLPDFGNFRIGKDMEYDRYKGVTELMPFAKGVSAKSHDFDDKGEETKTDFLKMMKIVLAAGYKGYVGIEYEGSKLSEPDGIRATKKLLERVFAELAKA